MAQGLATGIGALSGSTYCLTGENVPKESDGKAIGRDLLVEKKPLYGGPITTHPRTSVHGYVQCIKRPVA